MEFGTNSFDPKFRMDYVYGTYLDKISELQDYILFENHSLPSKNHTNVYIDKLTKAISKPVFVVSYKKGIGFESEFTQTDFDNIYSEDKKLKFYACLKGSEYTTNGVWHNLNPLHFRTPKISKEAQSLPYLKQRGSLIGFLEHIKYFRDFLKKYYNPLTTGYLENRFGRKILGLVFSLVTH